MLSYCTNPPDTSKPYDYAHGWKATRVRDYDKVRRCMAGWVWSPIVWKAGHRVGKDFHGALFAVLDFDDGGMTIDQATNEVFADYRHIIGTTKSHRRRKGGMVCDRFRVLLEFEQPVMDLHAYSGNMALLIDEYGADESAKDGARFFWPCPEIVAVNDDPESIRVCVKAVAKEDHESSLLNYERYGKLGVYPPFVRKHLAKQIPEGRRDTTIYGMAKDLAKCGYPLPLIISEIQQSPTYTSADDDHKRRFERACRSGYDRGKKEKPPAV